ncbi:transcriptional regulator, TetR family [Saccharopolyspora flava]|uniref:Transcriptional regulator, TetR family n=1 Tax=Saccharopolyspora flava TaxID=95161 RepID=A0A1I6TEP4_9PSEU|nr:transcriptional regulator, TetR family [Saccharopolyspora flava]
MLTSAEHVLSAGGLDDFTVAAVAEHAGVSVGAIYRRFPGKEQLLEAVKDQLLETLETDVREALSSAAPDLRSVVVAFTGAMADAFAGHTRAFPELLSVQSAEGAERGLRALDVVQRAFVDAARPHLEPDAGDAVRFAARSVIGACVHRAASCQAWPDGLGWDQWASRTADMALAYLGAEV